MGLQVHRSLHRDATDLKISLFSPVLFSFFKAQS